MSQSFSGTKRADESFAFSACPPRLQLHPRCQKVKCSSSSPHTAHQWHLAQKEASQGCFTSPDKGLGLRRNQPSSERVGLRRGVSPSNVLIRPKILAKGRQRASEGWLQSELTRLSFLKKAGFSSKRTALSSSARPPLPRLPPPQVVWKSSTMLGCASSFCEHPYTGPDPRFQGANLQRYYVVCREWG